MNIERFFHEHRECFDRFTFDRIFRLLLSDGYSHEDAKDLILFNCCLSAIIFQERIDNEFYIKIGADEKISDDLLQMKREIFNSCIAKYLLN